MLQGTQKVAPLLIDIPEAAEMLGISSEFVRRLIRVEALPHVRMGRLIRLRRKDVEAFASRGTRSRVENVTNQEATAS